MNDSINIEIKGLESKKIKLEEIKRIENQVTRTTIVPTINDFGKTAQIDWRRFMEE